MMAVSQAGGVPRRGNWILGGLAVLFGILTLVEGGHALFGGPEARAELGDIVPFVLQFNFAAGFVYLAVGAATLLNRPWALWGARALLVSTAVVFVALGVHIVGGGAYSVRTPVAMTVRTVFWLVQSWLLPRMLTAAAR